MSGKHLRFCGLRNRQADDRQVDPSLGKFPEARLAIGRETREVVRGLADRNVGLLTREEFAKIQQFRRTVRSVRRFVQAGVKRVVTALAICATALAGVPLEAATYYWDTDGTAAGNLTTGDGLGGTGVWDSSTSNWWDGADIVAWPNTFVDEAVFSGPATILSNTVTLNSGVQANRLSFLRSGYTLTGGSLALGGIDPSIYVNLAESVTIASPLLGADGLTLNGGGTLRLTGDNSGLTGAVTIAGGSLVINSAGALPGTGTVRVTAGNSTPSNGNLVGFTGGSLVLDGTAGGFTLGRDVNLEGRGVIGNNSSALLSLGNNTLTGIVTTASSLQTPATFRNTRINSVNGTLTFAGTLNVQGTAVSTFTTLGGVNTAGVGNFDISGVLQGSGSIEKAGAGTLFLNASDTSGFVGTIRISASATGQQSTLRVTQATVGGVSVFGANVGTGASSAIDLNGGTLEFRNDGDLDFGVLAGGKNVYSRTGSTIFTGPAAGGSGVGGTTTLGVLQQIVSTTASTATTTFNSRNGFGVTFSNWAIDASTSTSTLTNTVTNNMGGLLAFTGNATLGEGNTASRPRVLAVGGNGNTVILGSVIAGTDPEKHISKSGTGSLTIAGTATTIAGSVRVTAGAVIVTDFRSLNNNTAEISLGNATTTAGHLIIGGTGVAATAEGLTTSKTITLNTTTASNSIYANQDGAAPVILNGAITKIGTSTTGNLILGGTNTADNIVNVPIPAGTTGGLVKLGSGTWVLAADNTYAGATTIQNGVLKLHATGGASNVIGSTAAVTFSADGVTQSAGGSLEFLGFLDTDTTEDLGALTPTAGVAKIVVVGNGTGTANLTFTGLGTRGAGAAVDYQGGPNATISFSGLPLPSVTNGILGAASTSAYQTYNGIDWATLSSGQVVAYADYTALPASFSGTGGATLNYVMDADSETTGTATVNTIKFVGGADNPTLTLGGLLTLSARAILFDNTAGTATITGSQLGAASTEVHVIANGGTPTNALTIESLIGSGTGIFTKSGTGTVVVSGNNTFTGNVIINEGIVRMSGATATLGVNSTAANTLTIRQGATLDINGAGAAQTINALSLQGAGLITNSGGGNGTSATISLGRSTSTASTVFSGVLEDGDLLNGGGVLNVTINGTTARAQALIGDNTYTGVTTISTGAQVTVDVLADGGFTSGIGASTSAAGNLVFDGATPTLIYRGNIRNGSLNLGSTSATTDRLFTISGAGAVLSSTATNNNAIVWSSFGAIVHGTNADRTLTLTGTSTGDNTFNPQITDSTLFSTSLTKTGAGQWNLGNTDNTYTGATTINEGILALNDNGALSADSPLYMTPTSATSVAVLQMSGLFERELSSSLIVIPGAETVTFGFSAASTTGGVGFAAHGAPLTVAIGGLAAPTALTWGGGGFVGTGGVQNLVLNSTTALSYVDFRNAIDFGDSQRTINVLDNTSTGADYAIMSGVLSGAGGGLRKIGGGILTLTGANIYTGATALEVGTLRVTSLGHSGDAPNTATSVGISGVAMNDLNALTIGNGTTGAAILQYVGAGETTDRWIRLNSTGANQIHADGSGAWILTNLTNDMVSGARTLNLRGTSVAGNMITSQLSDNGGALSLTIDGGATWILTNGANDYTGTTTLSAGALGIGHDSAIGATLTISNGNVFAYGADRTVSNTVNLNNNASSGFLGDYNLTFTGTNNLAAGANNVNVYNSVAAGKAITFNGLVANSLTANRTWTLDGPGETVIDGNFTTTTAFGVAISKLGDGTLTLGGTGLSNYNQNNALTDIDRGTLKFIADNAMSSAVGAGGLTLSPEVLTGDVVTLDLHGTSQTVNAFTMSSDGTVFIDNTSASAATFRFGANNAAIAFGTGLGSYTVQNTGAGNLSLVKLGTTNVTFGSNLVLNHRGTTAVEGGSLTIAAALNGTTGLRVSNSGSSLVLSGGITTPATMTSVSVEGGTLLDLLDGAGSQMLNLTNLQLGSTGGTMTTLNLNVGDVLTAGDELGTDLLQLLSGGTLALFAGNQITLNLTDVGLSENQTYDLIRAVDGGLTSGPLGTLDWILGGAPGGFSSMTLVANDDRVYLQTGSLVQQTIYWRGQTNNTWNANVNNWSLSKDGLGTPGSIPGQGSHVVFQWDAPTSAAVVTTLEQNFRINTLTFEASSIPANTPTSVTINPGAVATNRLDVAPTDPLQGVAITAGGPANVTIAAAFRVGAEQTWHVADATSTLTLSGGLFGEADVTKTGLGTVVLSGPADPTFNAGQTTDFFVNDGKLIVSNITALGNVVNSNLARVIVNPDGLFAFSGAASTLPAPITLNGGTLAAGGGTQTYSGLVTVASSSTILMLDPLLVTATGRSITLSGGLSGSGMLTVNGINTPTEGNQETGTLTINQDNTAWTGNWNLLRGSVSTNNANGLGSGTLIAAEKGRFLLTGTARTQTIGHDILIASAAEASVLEFNFAAGISGIFSGGITLGGAGGFGELRVHMSTDADTAVITGGVVLANDGGLGVRDAAARFLHVDSVISEIGGSRSLRINHQAWGGTAGTVRLTALNTFSGDVVVARGTLEFNTVTNAGGAASSLGQGNTITLGAGAASILRFIGDGAANSQITNRAINITPDSTTNFAGTLAANGTNGASITYAGPISVSPNADGSWLVLTGLPGSQGFITGGITMVGGSADMTVNNGTWTIQDGLITIADDIFVTGENAVLNLNSTGVWTAVSPTGTSSGLYMRAGGTINLGANDINGANNANGLDFIMVGMDSTLGFTSTFNTNGFNITTPRLDVGGIADLTGRVLGGGTITGTYTGTDYGQGFRFFRGVVEANLAGDTTILKQGLGDVTLSGNNSGLTGAVNAAIRVDSGNLILDYTVHNTNKIHSNRALDMRGSTLTIVGNAGAATSQSVLSTTFATVGANNINVNAGTGQEAVLNLGAITRAASNGTVRFVLPSGPQSATNGITTNSLNNAATGLLASTTTTVGAYATVKDADGDTWFATNATNLAGGNIIGMISTSKDDVATWLSTDHVTNTAGYAGVISDISVRSLRFNAVAGGSLDIAEDGFLNIASGGLLVTDKVTGDITLGGGVISSSTTELIVTHDGSAVFDIGADIRVNNALTKTGFGTLALSGNNVFTGQTQLQNGILELHGGNALGDISLVTLSDDNFVTLRLFANETIGRLTGGFTSAAAGISQNDVAIVDVRSHTLTLNTVGGSVSYNGQFAGDGTIVKRGTGNQQLQNFTNSLGFTGNVIVEEGMLYMTNFGGLLNAAGITINKSGAFMLDISSTTRSTDRLAGTASITLNSADGTFLGESIVRGLGSRNNQNTSGAEVLGEIILSSGASYATLQATGGTSGTAVINASGGITRQNGATFNVRLTNEAASGGNRGQLLISGTPQADFIAGNLVGGGGAVGTTTMSIVPWAIGERTTGAMNATNMGNTLVTYVSGRGFVPLVDSEYATYAAAGATSNVKQSLTADLTGLAGKTINALVVNNSNTASVSVLGSGAGQTLVNTSGAFLFTVTDATTNTAYGTTLGGFDDGITVGGTNEYVFHVIKPETINSVAAASGFGAPVAGSNVLTVANATIASTLQPGMILSGAGIPTGARIISIDGTSVTIDRPVTYAATNTTWTYTSLENLTTTIASPLNSAADITKSGRGTLILTAVNSAGGGVRKTTLNEGVLEIADLDNIGGDNGALIFAGGTLRLGVGFTDDFSLRSISFLQGGATIDTNGISLALANSIGAGVGGLTKTGLGTLTLNSAATYTGATMIFGGTLAIGADNATGLGGDLWLGTGAVLDLVSHTLSAGQVTIYGNSPQLLGTGTINASRGFQFFTLSDTTIDASLGGAGGLFKNQVGALTLTALSTYAGITEVQAGTLVFDSIADVGGGPSSLGAPTTVENGIIRMGLTTTATALTYIGAGHSSNRVIGLQSTTAAVTINANGDGALGLGGAHVEVAGNKTLILRGTSAPTIANTIGAIRDDGLSLLSVTKSDANTWVLNGTSSYRGTTTVADGTLRIDAAQSLAGILTFGTATTAGILELNNVDSQFGGMTVVTNSASLGNMLDIDAGRTLTITGDVTIGANANESQTLLYTSGGGAFVVANLGGTFQVGGAVITTTANENAAIADFAGLSSFSVDLGNTGVMRIGDNSINTGVGRLSVLTLATDSTIKAGTLQVAATTTSGLQTLQLGSGTNILNVETLRVGGAARGAGLLNFADTTGTLRLRGYDDTGAAVVDLGAGTSNAAQNFVATMDLSGHQADLLVSTLTMASRSDGTGSTTATFTFDDGILDIETLNMASRTGGTGASTATVNLGDGLLAGTPQTTIDNLIMGTAIGTGGVVTATLNISGGNVAIGTGFGTAVNMATAGAGRTVNSEINLTGGSTSIFGSIERSIGLGAENAVITLNGGRLNFNGNMVGASGTGAINFVAQSGTLANLGQLNGGGALNKTTGGRLIVEGDNNYTGATNVNEGTLSVNGAIFGSGTVTVAAGATLNGNGSVAGNTVVNGTLSAGSSSAGDNGHGVGGLTLAGGSTWNNGASFVFDFAATDLGTTVPTVGSTDWDFLSIGGGLTLASGASYTLSIRSWLADMTGYGLNDFDATESPSIDLPEDPSQQASYRWLWADVNGALTGDGIVDGDAALLSQFSIDTSMFNGNSPLASGGSFWVSASGGDLYLNYSSVPEPSSLALVGLASLGLAAYRRRKRKLAEAAETMEQQAPSV